jgi:ribonuclease HI
MEMQGVIGALEAIPDSAMGNVTVFTDSKYVIDGITKWVAGWKRRGWQTAEKTPVKNRDLWERLDELHRRFLGRIEWRHVPGHRGIPGNERVDEIASLFARKRRTSLFNGHRSAYQIELGPKKSRRIDKSEPRQLVMSVPEIEEASPELSQNRVTGQKDLGIRTQIEFLKLKGRHQQLQAERDQWRDRAQAAEAALELLRSRVAEAIQAMPPCDQ